MSLPTLIVELDRDGVLNGAVLDDPETANLDSAILEYHTPTYAANITEFVRGFQTQRGAQRELQRVEAGTATIRLDNRDGRFTPYLASSPYYPDVLPMRRIRIRASFIDVPETIAGLRIWWDMTDISRLFQDTGLTSPVSSDGQIIKGVSDKSGNNNHATEATNGPTYKVNIFGNNSVARFDGTNDRLSRTGLSADASFTVFIVAQKRTAPGGSSQALWATSNAAQIYTNSGTHATAYNWFLADSGGTGIVANATTMGIITLRINSASSLDAYKNGGAASNFDPNAAVTTDTVRGLGDNTGAANFGDYDIAEVIEYDSALIASDINVLGQYFGTKYGITWTNVS